MIKGERKIGEGENEGRYIPPPPYPLLVCGFDLFFKACSCYLSILGAGYSLSRTRAFFSRASGT
jgi:hypothetical protein